MDVSNLAITVTPELVEKFKKQLESWRESSYGALAPNFFNDLQIVEKNGHRLLTISLDTMAEERSTQSSIRGSKKNTLPDFAAISPDKVDPWNIPTPDSFKSSFEVHETTNVYLGTAHYVPCKDCKEAGEFNCGSCNQTGKITCVTCNGNRKINCSACNGYGELNCGTCSGAGRFDTNCPACHKGGVDCNACGGKGHHRTSNGDKFPCRSCNGTGDDRCTKCGGVGQIEVVCRDCRNGNVECRTCRTQKLVNCHTCSANGQITCLDCKGTTTIPCKPCESQGGFKKSILVKSFTSIHPNSLFLSPLENMSERKMGKNTTVSSIAPQHTLEELVTLSKESDLKPHLEEIYNHVNATKASTNLLEQFRIDESRIYYFKTNYNNSVGLFMYDEIANKLYVEQDPLKNYQQDTEKQLVSEFNKALAQKDYSSCENVLKKLLGAKLAQKEKELRQKMLTQIRTLDEAARTKLGRFFHLGTFLGVSTIVWLCAAFIVPMSVPVLITSYILIFTICRPEGGFNPKPDKKEVKKGYIAYLKLVAIWIVVLALNQHLVHKVEAISQDVIDGRSRQVETK